MLSAVAVRGSRGAKRASARGHWRFPSRKNQPARRARARRILTNLGLIENEKSSMKDIYCVMKDISEKMDIDVVELDTLLFSYGRVYGDEIII